ncbi:SCO family protein [Natronospirillum operosum]|uniref:SCO family protein n=1 Tax=Natronospirillum operosum TaxID=2759953 RepID=A0A4Z0WI54_9GAMM|nr:SCO family protein [Natronospirillum operosum]TGG95557.1 SCO family protein [Natronospirillum operosum]
MATLTPRTRLLLVLLSLGLCLGLAVTGWLIYRAQALPEVQGVVMGRAAAMPEFTLTDHRQEPFSNENLQGRWHLLTYGFTHCPDICPGTLAAMASVVRQLEQDGSPYDDLDLLFYTVDPERDTASALADYVPFFHPRATGLTLNGHVYNRFEAFERSLGIVYEIPEFDRFGEPYPDDSYPVNHGVKVYLLNPGGRLQAVFEPAYSEHGMVHFSATTLLRDYLRVRQHLDG